METTVDKLLNGRPIFHATPIHYLPLILEARELRCQRIVGYEMARRTARRRDRQLAVDHYVHFSLKQESPLLNHKLEKGFPHAVLRFNTNSFSGIPWSILPCSTKAWRSKWQCQPVSGRAEMERILQRYDSRARFPGLEILVRGLLSLTHLAEIITFSDIEAELVRKLCLSIGVVSCPVTVSRSNVENYSPINIDEIREYFAVCCALREALPPPNLPFD
jgi:hypothetical protein